MDNITHSLIGAAVGRAWPEKFGAENKSNRTALVLTSVLANNLPDADFILPTLLGGGGKISYLLHHRGYTHSVLGIALLAFVAAWIGKRFTRKSAHAFFPLYLIGLLGGVLHVFADSWNNYGVHPFSPFFNRWFHGDFIFILEPLLWAAILPYLLVKTRNKKWRAFFALLAFGIFAATIASPYTPFPVPLFVAAGFLIFGVFQYFLPGFPACLVSFVSVLLLFLQCMSFISLEVTRAYPLQETDLEVASTPMPANPFCWQVVVASRASAASDDFIVRLGGVAMFPKWIPIERCFNRFTAERTAPLVATSLSESEHMHWLGEFTGKISHYNELRRKFCVVEGLTRFTRSPFYIDDESRQVVGDVRYDRGKGLGFSGFDLKEEPRCPSWLPPWEPPLKFFR